MSAAVGRGNMQQVCELAATGSDQTFLLIGAGLMIVLTVLALKFSRGRVVLQVIALLFMASYVATATAPVFAGGGGTVCVEVQPPQPSAPVVPPSPDSEELVTAVNDTLEFDYDCPSGTNPHTPLNLLANDSSSVASLDAATIDLDPDTAGVQTSTIINLSGGVIVTVSLDGDNNLVIDSTDAFTAFTELPDHTITYTVQDTLGNISNQATSSFQAGIELPCL